MNNTDFCQKYLKDQVFLEDVLQLSIFHHHILLLQHHFFSMRLQWIKQMSPFYSYTRKIIKVFDGVESSIIFVCFSLSFLFEAHTSDTNSLFFWINTFWSHNFLLFIRAVLTGISHFLFYPLIIFFSLIIAVNSSWLISMPINAWDAKVSMLLSLLSDNTRTYHAFSFCFLLCLVLFLLFLLLGKKIK